MTSSSSPTSHARPQGTPRQEAVSERRLVSVLFADLVGFTAASEGRDAEDTRELLTRYFDTCRTIIERYGGTVEKFIGDAVMAVWGAPVANEDDAERAVRAALELIDAVPGLDPALRARAGVLTGEAAVTLGATDQGMVAGDLVNTASRIQSAAEPGTVLVGETTRRASEAAIAFADAGAHALKGKAEQVQLSRAIRVSAQRRGEGRAVGLEAPFVGRAGELRLVKDLFNASVDQSRARLVSVIGVAGIGKSRLSWEFEKYIDGVAADVWWHRGRCLSYGEGVAFWALSEMVRGRAKILEDEDAHTSISKLRAVLEVEVVDAEERAWIEPRLLHLLGLAERTAADREDLFSAWRRFFELLAEQGPLVMVFEDIHWADEGLVAFIEYLLDWGRHHPIFVLTLARPEVADRHPGFPGSNRSAATLPLEPLADEAMDELLTGLVPGIPDDVRRRLRDAADGIPLYAVETVRMLRDRGVLEQVGDDVLVTGDLSTFEVPETLHALIASRLDGVPEEERKLLQDASVLGKTFTARGLASLSGLDQEAVDRLVASLVRKELLAVETDPFSPERGQLGFLQALVQRVTYETIARRDRRARHLAVAGYLATDAGIDPDEIAEVIATHYLDAHEADENAADAADVRAEARRWFTRAADRAASLAASLEAQRAFERAADLTDEGVERGHSLARAGELALMGGRMEEAEPLLEEAISILEAANRRGEAAGAQARLGEVLFVTGRIEGAVAQLEQALTSHEAAGDEAAIATVSAQLGRFLFFEGRGDDAMPHVERALELSERLRLTDVVVEALINKALVLRFRPNESLGLMRQALLLAEEANVPRGALRACMNLSYLLALAGKAAEADAVIERGIALARRRGDRVWERSLMTNLISTYFVSGRWDEVERAVAEIPEEGRLASDPVQASTMLDLAQMALYRGALDRVIELATEYASWGETANTQAAVVRVWACVLVAQAERRHDDALSECLDALRGEAHNADPIAVEVLLQLGCESAALVGDADALGALLSAAAAAPIDRSPSLEAHTKLHEARLAVLRGEDEPCFEDAVAALREVGEVFWVGTALLEQAEWLAGREHWDEIAPLLAEGREVFERLRAQPRLERLEAIQAARSTSASSSA
ncbi:AAA family ATPase [Gaiella sp.]|uniref:ATP-binding protein n=1 Tax=Gaiella sp. TaxID=2663207 RepID=UPI003263A00A